jgi:hypothetical protein
LSFSGDSVDIGSDMFAVSRRAINDDVVSEVEAGGFVDCLLSSGGARATH